MRDRTVYEQALTLLEFRTRSVSELRRKLLQKGADAAEVEGVLLKLRDQRLLDDADFARQFARNKLTGAGSSRRRIAQELGQKGIPRQQADEAIRQLTEEDGLDPAASAQRVAEKKWKSLAKLDDFTRRRRLYAFLARRGFDPDEIRTVMQELGAD